MKIELRANMGSFHFIRVHLPSNKSVSTDPTNNLVYNVWFFVKFNKFLSFSKLHLLLRVMFLAHSHWSRGRDNKNMN